MLNAILRDTFAKIDGKLPKGRKMHLHSGHDINLVCMLKLFGIFEPHTPSYAAHLLIELHNINDVYGFKVRLLLRVYIIYILMHLFTDLLSK